MGEVSIQFPTTKFGSQNSKMSTAGEDFVNRFNLNLYTHKSK